MTTFGIDVLTTNRSGVQVTCVTSCAPSDRLPRFSIPAALLLAQVVDTHDTPDDVELPVIADTERHPLPPHLRQPETVADLS